MRGTGRNTSVKSLGRYRDIFRGTSILQKLRSTSWYSRTRSRPYWSPALTCFPSEYSSRPILALRGRILRIWSELNASSRDSLNSLIELLIDIQYWSEWTLIYREVQYRGPRIRTGQVVEIFIRGKVNSSKTVSHGSHHELARWWATVVISSLTPRRQISNP